MKTSDGSVAAGPRRWVLACMLVALTLLLGACASTETVKEARGQGVSRSYPFAFDNVFNATLAAAKANKLEIVESDRSTGRLVLSHGVTWWSWGEKIAVFIKMASPQSTEVEIVSKPVMAPLNFPPDWEQILLARIDAELRGGARP